MSDRKKSELLKAIELSEKFEIDPTKGLNDEQIEKRTHEGLDNKTPKKVTKSYWKIFKDNFLTFFNVVLFVIAALMVSAKLDIMHFLFLFILLANIAIGFITDIRARRLVEKLKVITDPKIKVIRNGKEIEIRAEKAVLSDISILKAGEQICSDSKVISGEITCDESLLTGESEPVKKKPGDIILSGSFVKSGKCTAEIIRVGIANYAESLQDSAKQFKRPKTEIKKSCLAIFWTTGIIAIIIGAMYLITWLLSKGFSDDGFTFDGYVSFVKSAGSSMVATIPSGLYLLFSVSLATGVIRLANKRMNVQELYCIEMLARIDVICFDKTGTLTTGDMVVRGIKNYSDYTDEEIKLIIGNVVFGTGDDNPTATALKKYAEEYTEIPAKTICFDSEYKYSAVELSSGTYILGALGFVDCLVNEDAAVQNNELSSSGLRVVGLYHNKDKLPGEGIPNNNDLLCLIYLSDNLKSDAKDNIEWFVGNGVDIKVISGDNPAAVSEIASHAGVPNANKYISMDQIKDEDIPSLVDNYSVFGRANPEQKALILKALQNNGHKVAMTGDGVNDIVALKTADCSIAMASGSPAARSVAHIVSVDNDFSKLPDVVSEGRRVINNLQRTSSLFLAKTIFAIVISVIFLIISWGGGPSYPFTTKNLIVWEIFGIGFSGFILALQPSKERLKGKFLGNIISKSLPAGIVQIIAVLSIFTISTFAKDVIIPDATVSACVIVFSAISLFILCRICWPFDLYRGIVVFGTSLISISLFIADSFTKPGPYGSVLFGLNYPAVLESNVWVIAGVMVACLVLYFLIDMIFTKILHKGKKKGDNNED